VVFFFTDHGMRFWRHKQFCHDGGLHVPLIVAWFGTDKVASGKVREDLVSGIDIGATSLGLAGIGIPEYMEGRDLFAADFEPREYVISARDRCDYTIDRIRTVRTQQYRYIRNFKTDRPYMQPNYRDGWESSRLMRKLYADGKLNEVQARFWAKERPEEELYHIAKDPHETVNLAGDPRYADVLSRHREILEKWVAETDDKGQYPEKPEGLRFMLEYWGNKCTNPEYDAVR
jgi:arylsulfatase A-like enzyme